MDRFNQIRLLVEQGHIIGTADKAFLVEECERLQNINLQLGRLLQKCATNTISDNEKNQAKEICRMYGYDE